MTKILEFPRDVPAAVLRAFGDDDAAGGNAETDGALLDKVRENDTLKKISVMLGKYREIIADKRKNSFSYGLRREVRYNLR